MELKILKAAALEEKASANKITRPGAGNDTLGAICHREIFGFAFAASIPYKMTR